MDLAFLTQETLTLTTERLTLLPMQQQHLAEFRALQNDPTLMRFIGPLLDETALTEKFEQRINCFNDHQQWFTLLIFERYTQTFIGSIGFKIADNTGKRVEIGYLTLAHAQGKGYITEAGHVLIAFLKESLNVKKITANCATENIASWKVMEKLGLIREGCLKADFYLNDQWLDSYIYGLVFD